MRFFQHRKAETLPPVQPFLEVFASAGLRINDGRGRNHEESTWSEMSRALIGPWGIRPSSILGKERSSVGLNAQPCITPAMPTSDYNGNVSGRAFRPLERKAPRLASRFGSAADRSTGGFVRFEKEGHLGVALREESLFPAVCPMPRKVRWSFAITEVRQERERAPESRANAGRM